MQYLLDSKKEYIDIILDNITSPICNSIYDMYKSSKNIQEFQSKMANIKNWNNYNINEYYLSILKLCKIKNIQQILNQIIILNVQLKTEKKNINPNSIKFIDIEDFIYKCLVNASIYCWKNVYLFAHKNLKPSEKQYHLNIIEKNIKKIIKSTIRDCTPFDFILDNITFLTDLDPIRIPVSTTNEEIKNIFQDYNIEDKPLNKILLDKQPDELEDEEESEEESEEEDEQEEEEQSEIEVEVKKEIVVNDEDEKREIYIASDNESIPKKKTKKKEVKPSDTPESSEQSEDISDESVNLNDSDDIESIKSIDISKIHPLTSDSDVSIKEEKINIKSPIPTKRNDKKLPIKLKKPITPSDSDVSIKEEKINIKSPIPTKRNDKKLPIKLKKPITPSDSEELTDKEESKSILNDKNLNGSKKKLVFATNSSSEDEEKTNVTNKLYKSEESDDDEENYNVKTIKINSSSRSRYYS